MAQSAKSAMRGSRSSRTRGNALQAMHRRIEERAQNLRPRELELPPERLLRTALRFGDRVKRQQDGAVGEIGPGDDILDAVENDRPGGRKQHLVLIGVELADREGAAARRAGRAYPTARAASR